MSLSGLPTRLVIIVLVAFPGLAFQIHTETQAHAARRQLMRDEGPRMPLLSRSGQQRIVEGADQVSSVIANASAVRATVPLLANLPKERTRYTYAAPAARQDDHLSEPT